MSSSWDYGGAFERHPIERGTAVFDNGSRLRMYNIFDPLPDFMRGADLIFTDPPWNQGNMSSFYTKAALPLPVEKYAAFCARLFECVGEIAPKVCYLEIGKDHLADFIVKMRGIFEHVTFYNSTYYHKSDHLCYVVRGSRRAQKPRLDGMDEENIIEWVCRNEDYECIGDLCMGRGLVAVNAFNSAHRFVGTELNHKRLSVAIERVYQQGGRYHIEYQGIAEEEKANAEAGR